MTVSRFLWALLLLAVGLVPARADDDKPPLTIARDDGVQYGFPSSMGNQGCRVGAWMPVYVKLVCGDNPISAGQYQLVVETNDSDDVQNEFLTPVPSMRENEERVVITYARPGTLEARIRVGLREGRRDVPVPKSPAMSPDVLAPSDILYLTVGPEPSQLREAVAPDRRIEDFHGRIRFAHVHEVGRMPDRWFGYGAVDTVFMTTGSELIGDLRDGLQSGGRSPGAALGEWVRRGGCLVISVGRNHQTAGEFLSKLGLIDCKFGAQSTVKTAVPLSGWSSWRGEALTDLPVTALEPGPGVTTLVATAPTGKTGKAQPLVVTAPCGLGRVVVLAFDTESNPFSNWKGRSDFWKRVHQEVKPRLATVSSSNKAAGLQSSYPELGKSLQQSLETFEEVPVISFGWVALFIFIYILIVGPLDYFFLKKVVKRLELTWVTFPLVVVVISVAAYFIAYHVKGNDLRINKTDVIDFDLTRGKDNNLAVGTTWCTLFSPRQQNYVIGVEPSSAWVPAQSNPLVDFSPVVTTLSPPDSGPGSMNRSSSISLFSQSYVYADGAAGLEGVPIPVWASRSFAATWQAPLGQQSPLKHNLQPNVARTHLMGSITNDMPAELTEVYLHYQGRWYPINEARSLAPGQTVSINGLNMQTSAAGGASSEWLTTDFQAFRRAPEETRPAMGGFQQATQAFRAEQLMKSILFYSADNIKHAGMDNSNLRPLDQGWRLKRLATFQGELPSDRYLNEVILVGRVRIASSDAEAVHTEPGSPTQLWLGRLPGHKDGRPKLDGKMSQDTYVRIFIPVADSGK